MWVGKVDFSNTENRQDISIAALTCQAGLSVRRGS